MIQWSHHTLHIYTPVQVFTISVNHDDGFMKLLFYAKYWITNKTNMTLQYTVYSDSTTVVVLTSYTFRDMDLIHLLTIQAKMK